MQIDGTSPQKVSIVHYREARPIIRRLFLFCPLIGVSSIKKLPLYLDIGDFAMLKSLKHSLQQKK